MSERNIACADNIPGCSDGSPHAHVRCPVCLVVGIGSGHVCDPAKTPAYRAAYLAAAGAAFAHFGYNIATRDEAAIRETLDKRFAAADRIGHEFAKRATGGE